MANDRSCDDHVTYSEMFCHILYPDLCALYILLHGGREGEMEDGEREGEMEDGGERERWRIGGERERWRMGGERERMERGREFRSGDLLQDH